MMKSSSYLASLHVKLASSLGETLVETLVAVLVSSMSMLMLATAIGAATNIVTRNHTIAENYYAATDMLAASSTAGKSSDVISATGATSGNNGTVTIAAPDGFAGLSDSDALTIDYVTVNLPGVGSNGGASYKVSES